MSHTTYRVPEAVSKGTTLTKVSHKKLKKCHISIDADQGQILYESKKDGTILLSAIREIRCGSDARYYRTQFDLDEQLETRWMTIIYTRGSDHKMLHLVADDISTFDLWREAVTHLYSTRQSLMDGLGETSRRQDMWIRENWKKANAKRPDEKLDLDEVLSLAKSLHAACSSEEVKKWFNLADEDHLGHLNFPAFQRFVKLLTHRKDIEEIYNAILPKGATSLDFTAFEQFCLGEQKAEESTIDNDWNTYSSQPPSPNGSMDLDEFVSFLTNNNSALDPVHKKLHQDMTRPLTDYYISASHNTYLVGHQLVGDSTIEGYVRALLMGCKSVELDIYDGDDDEEPMIYHGKTLTSEVSLRDVCRVINKYAFVVSDYPVVISAEVHCGLEKQELIYQIMVEVFGEALIRAPIEGRPKIERLPSPEDMKGKILLKAKNLFVSSGLDQARSESVAHMPPVLEAETASSSSDSEGVVDGIKGIMSKLRSKKTKPKPKMSFALASLLVYTVGVKCRGLSKEDKYSPEHIFSLSENAGGKLCGREEFLAHSHGHMVRIYPRGTRVSSTNYLPHIFWATGAQLVAMNVQTPGMVEGLEMNSAFFRMNGKSGYVLKPEPLRSLDLQALRTLKKYHLRCKVISAQHLPTPRDESGKAITTRSAIDPFVQVKLHVPDWYIADSMAQRESSLSPQEIVHCTKVVKDNGFDPSWNEEFSFSFDCASEEMLRLVFLEFEVKLKNDDEDDDPIAQYTVSLGQLRQGYRHLPLHDLQLTQFLYSSLFIKTSIEASST